MKINDFGEAKRLVDDYNQIKESIKALTVNGEATDVNLFVFGGGGENVKTELASTRYSTEAENDAAGAEIRNSMIKILTIRKENIKAKLLKIGVEIPGLDEMTIKVKVNFQIEDGK